MKIGSLAKLDKFVVKIIDIFECDGVQYAEVEPADFHSISREVELSRLEEIA